VYGSWCQQLAAYRRAIGQPVACMSVIVNSTEPTALVERVWTEEELRAGLESFEAALVIWRNEKCYDPRRASNASNQSSVISVISGETAPVLVAGMENHG
jgi:hypothetical protein